MDCSYSTMPAHIKGKHLSYEERVLIQILLKYNHSIRVIAREIGCSPSTVSNEMSEAIEKNAWQDVYLNNSVYES